MNWDYQDLCFNTDEMARMQNNDICMAHTFSG